MAIDLRPKRTVQELNNGIKVYQNFMRESDFQKFLRFFERLPWFIDNIYNSSVPEEYQDQNFLPHQDFEPDPKYNTQLSHFLFHVEQGAFPTTELQKELFSAIFSNIGTIFDVYAWVKIKANITFCTEHIIEHGFHVDRMPLTTLSESQTTAVLHLDDSDGYTKFFQDNIKIPSKPNQLITFPSHLYHTGTTCTDQDKRQVLNLNFFGTPC
tara:strand:+ start:189 stop:821 length:633 start_codon:yes stop_codon:yes gene_type:complete